MIRVTENLGKIRDLLTKAALEAERDPGSIRLLAVTKKQPLQLIADAVAAGQRDFGENFVQEGLERIRKLPQEHLVWHFIGHLQTNKTRAVAENFDWIHTLDRLKTAERLSRHRPDALGDLNVCLQVNVDDEAEKSGVRADALPDLAAACAALPRLKLRGLMCLPSYCEDFDEQRVPFARLRALKESLAADGIAMDTLSMGMSGDYRAAICEGATIVRIGTAVFGPRPS